MFVAHNHDVLPQGLLPIDLPIDLPFDLPVGLPKSLPFDLPSGLPPATWMLVGLVAAAVVLVVARRIRRLVLLATVASVGFLVAWNAGFLPSLS